MRITHFSAACGRTQELRCRGGPEPPSQFAPGCPGKLREKSLGSSARRRIPTVAAASAAHPASPPLSLPGPGAEEAVEVSCPVPGVRPCSSSQGDTRCPAAPLLPGAPSAPKRNGPDPGP
nr:translation initiation factor IF-2-like [Taeniopygia guttata]